MLVIISFSDARKFILMQVQIYFTQYMYTVLRKSMRKLIFYLFSLPVILSSQLISLPLRYSSNINLLSKTFLGTRVKNSLFTPTWLLMLYNSSYLIELSSSSSSSFYLSISATNQKILKTTYYIYFYTHCKYKTWQGLVQNKQVLNICEFQFFLDYLKNIKLLIVTGQSSPGLKISHQKLAYKIIDFSRLLERSIYLNRGKVGGFVPRTMQYISFILLQICLVQQTYGILRLIWNLKFVAYLGCIFLLL